MRDVKDAKIGDSSNKTSESTKTAENMTNKGFFGNRNAGFEMKNPKYQKYQNFAETINGRKFTGHALDQMRNRGIPISAVENAIKTGVKTLSKTKNCWEYRDVINNIKVVISKDTGNVVTVMFGV